MRGQDLRFYVPETPEQELALAHARVRERREGLKLALALFGGCALLGAAFALGAHASAGAARVLIPAILILVVIPGAALAIVSASSLIWQARLRLLTREQAQKAGGEAVAPAAGPPFVRIRQAFPADDGVATPRLARGR